MPRLCIRIRPSRRRGRVAWGLVVVLVGAGVGMLSADHFWLLPLLLSIQAGLLFSLQTPQVDDQLSITEKGEGRWVSDQTACQLLPGSLLTPFMLALRVSATSPATGSSQWQLIFKDQVTARGWRRLRRIALNLNH